MHATPIYFTVGGKRNDIEGIADEETNLTKVALISIYPSNDDLEVDG